MTNPASLAADVMQAPTLDALLAALRAVEDAGLDTDEIGADMSALPLFGGDEPASTSEIWSWDADRLLIGTCISDMEIISRADWAAR